jgi:hypothetical protein
MSPAVRDTLRHVATSLALEPPDPLDDPTDPEWEMAVLDAEAKRQARAAERATARFHRTCRGAGRQALFDGQGDVLAQLVAADLPVTPETLAWAAGLEDPALLPIEAPVEPVAVKAATALTTRVVSIVLRARSRRAALEEIPLDLAAPVTGVSVSEAAATQVLGGLTPLVHRRAAIKRALKDLWRNHSSGRFAATCPEHRWERLAWLAFVGFALPPVFPDQRRWEARAALTTALAGTGLAITHVLATLERARKVVLGEALEAFAHALRPR